MGCYDDSYNRSPQIVGSNCGRAELRSKSQSFLLVASSPRCIPGSGVEHEGENNSHTVQRKKRTILMVGRPQLVSLFAGAVSRPELRFTELLVPRIMIAWALGFLVAWLVVAIMEHTCLSRYVWHIPLLFLALIVLFSSLQCHCRSPPNHGKGAGQRSGFGGSRRRAWMVRVVSGFVFAVRLGYVLPKLEPMSSIKARRISSQERAVSFGRASGKRPEPIGVR